MRPDSAMLRTEVIRMRLTCPETTAPTATATGSHTESPSTVTGGSSLRRPSTYKHTLRRPKDDRSGIIACADAAAAAGPCDKALIVSEATATEGAAPNRPQTHAV